MSESATSSNQPNGRPTHDICVVKDGHLYRFVAVEPGDDARLLDLAIEHAQDPGSAIDWFDAAMIAHELGRRLTSHLHQHDFSPHGGP